LKNNKVVGNTLFRLLKKIQDTVRQLLSYDPDSENEEVQVRFRLIKGEDYIRRTKNA
jgi:hypothetical protein